jgi:hypothetical protein
MGAKIVQTWVFREKRRAVSKKKALVPVGMQDQLLALIEVG